MTDHQTTETDRGQLFKWMRSMVSAKKARKHITHHLCEGASWNSFFFCQTVGTISRLLLYQLKQHFCLRHCTCYNSYHSYTCSWADALNELELFYTPQAYFFYNHSGKCVGFCLDGTKNGAIFQIVMIHSWTVCFVMPITINWTSGDSAWDECLSDQNVMFAHRILHICRFLTFWEKERFKHSP